MVRKYLMFTIKPNKVKDGPHEYAVNASKIMRIYANLRHWQFLTKTGGPRITGELRFPFMLRTYAMSMNGTYRHASKLVDG